MYICFMDHGALLLFSWCKSNKKWNLRVGNIFCQKLSRIDQSVAYSHFRISLFEASPHRKINVPKYFFIHFVFLWISKRRCRKDAINYGCSWCFFLFWLMHWIYQQKQILKKFYIYIFHLFFCSKIFFMTFIA